jgi:hypothetical protein
MKRTSVYYFAGSTIVVVILSAAALLGGWIFGGCVAPDGAAKTTTRTHRSLVVPVTILAPPCPGMTATRLQAADASAEDQFGNSVDASGNVAVVGAWQDDPKAYDSGSAYVFRWNGTVWVQEQKLFPADGANSDRFGVDVAVSAGVAVVGALYDDDRGADSGSLYVYRHSGVSWVMEQKITPADGQAGDFLGSAVAISGNLIAASAYGDDDRGNYAGAVYVWEFNGTTWVQNAKLYAPDAAASDFFGVDLALSGDSIVVGSYLDDDRGSGSGSAYVFRRTTAGWTQEAKLVASDGAANDLFGWHVALEGPQALVGSLQSDALGSESGAAYLFRREASGWRQEAKVLASDGAKFDKFGSAVAISGSAMTVGAFWWELNPAGPTDTGAAYQFGYDPIVRTWHQEAILVADGGWFNDQFGSAAAMDGNVTVIGTPMESRPSTKAGAAYVFRGSCGAPPPECIGDEECGDDNACTIDSCVAGRCTHGATTSACDDGNACTIDDACVNGVCKGTPLTCNNGVPTP